MCPGLAGIGGLVNAITHGEIGPLQALAAAHINNVGIGSRYGYGANGAGGLLVKNGSPRSAVVGGLPHSAVAHAYVKDIRLAGDAGGGLGASATKGANAAPVQRLQIVRIHLLRKGHGQSSQTENDEKTQDHKTAKSVHNMPPERQRRIPQNSPEAKARTWIFIGNGSKSLYLSSSNSAFIVATPPDTPSLRSHVLKPFFVIFIEWSPAGRFTEEGVLPTNLPSTSISADPGVEEMETAVNADTVEGAAAEDVSGALS